MLKTTVPKVILHKNFSLYCALYGITWLKLKHNILQFQQITQPTVIEQAAYILIAAGAFMFLVSFLGYCGALRESRCLLTCVSIAVIHCLI
jgi:hypothetical protein